MLPLPAVSNGGRVWLRVPLALLAAIALHAQTDNSTVAYLYPSTTDLPLNSKILVGVTCCSGQDASLSAGGRSVPARVERFLMRDSTAAFVLTPSTPLLPRTLYQVTISLYNKAPLTTTFTTGTTNDTTPPTVVQTTPADGQDVASAKPNVVVQFSKAMYPGSLPDAAPALTALAAPLTSLYLFWTFPDPTKLTLENGTYGLQQGTAYRLHFGSKLPQDLAGNALVVPPDVVFTTYAEAPKDGPQIKGTVPLAGESSIPTNSAIYLQFDRAISPPDVSAFTLSAATDPSVSLKVDPTTTVPGGLIIRPQTLLRSNQDYILGISQIFDLYGGHSSGFTLHFHTGLLPETRPLATVSAPAPILPNVPVLRWTFSRALNPYILPRLGRLDAPFVYLIQSTPTRLLSDGVTIEADVPAPGVYMLSGPILDRVQHNGINQFGSAQVTVQPNSDTQAPSPLAIFPVPGSSVSSSAQPNVYFDENLDATTAGQATLTRGDTVVPADVSISGAFLTIRPKQTLPDGDYRVEIHARDAGGNTGDAIVWTFHVPADPVTDKFAVVGFDPPDAAQNVDPHTPITITFNRPPNPMTFFLGLGASVTTSLGAVTGRWRFDGNQAIFAPDPAFPGGVRVSWSATPSDAAGNRVFTSGGFWTPTARLLPTRSASCPCSPHPRSPISSPPCTCS
jgi:hypothetical protein